MEFLHACGIHHLCNQLIECKTSLLNFELDLANLNVLTLECVFMEFSVAAAHPNHDVPLVQSHLDYASTHHVPVKFNHLDWHPNVILFDELSQSLIHSISYLSLIRLLILEVRLSLAGYYTTHTAILRREETTINGTNRSLAWTPIHGGQVRSTWQHT